MSRRDGMPFEPDATQVGLARGAADRAMVRAKETMLPQHVGEWTARELRAFRIEDAARLETLAEAPVMLVAEPEPAKIDDEPELPPVQCARPGCHHSKARHTGARVIEELQVRDSGLATACDESGCPCDGFRETEPDRVVANSSEKDDEGESPTRVESYPLYPRTAREALLEIRRMAAEVVGAGSFAEPETQSLTGAIDEIAGEGLARIAPENFELTDQLADRLAEAHTLIARLKGPAEAWPKLGEINEVLSLPPDLEAMVERRMKR